MTHLNLRKKPRISYCEYEEPNLDEYVYCNKCTDFVYEYCSIHGPLLVIPDDKVSSKPEVPSFVPRAALTIPQEFLHIAPSIIPGAGLGVFSTITLPADVRFGPYRGHLTKDIDSMYCWMLHDGNNKWSRAIDAADANSSNWMRYVNCARHYREQNLVAYQYQGQIYYRTIKLIPRFTELMVFYGGEFALLLGINLRLYNEPDGFAQVLASSLLVKSKDTSISEEKLQNELAIEKNAVVDENNSVKRSKKVMQRHVEPKTQKAKNSHQRKNKSSMSNAIDNNNNFHPQPLTTNDFDENGRNDAVATEVFVCDICERKFNFKHNLELHMKEHYNKNTHNTKQSNSNNANLIRCETCNNYFTRCYFKVHLRVHTKERPYKCDKRFTRNDTLKQHLLVHNKERPYKCDICDKRFTRSSHLKTHLLVHTGEKPYKCDICDKRFTRSSHLKTHLLVHTGEKPYKCDICDKRCTHSGHLKTHLLVHTGEKPYKCDICDKRFTCSSSLKTHLLIHTGEKPYQCDICDKRFTCSSSLKTHLLIHTGEKPYQCDICDKRFTQSGHLKTHLLVHTEEKPYKCDICDKRFTCSSSLKTHLLIHTGEKPYQCDICDKRFTCSSSLKTHLLIHTGEKPYQCDICDKRFTCSSSLKTHLLVHTGEKPYQCDICDKRFNRSGTLKRHLLVHSRQNPY